MKMQQVKVVFRPVVLTLETPEEVEALRAIAASFPIPLTRDSAESRLVAALYKLPRTEIEKDILDEKSNPIE